ncbi:MAG: tryptophan--tRNA ligase [Chloroflexi bacterium]|nr:tryptophan--tRNA ligase [Chloroflexota bacterium]
MDTKKRVFSGARPTGRQHLGNYLGAIKNYVRLQDQYQCIYCIVDLHALTTLEETAKLRENVREMMLDWLAAGLDPGRSILFVQSHVPEVTELATLFGMLTPLSWLLRVPTFKEKARNQPQNVNYGLVGYPVLMAADISLYKAEVVPVGEDQIPHLELAREIVRRFNLQFGRIFPEPHPELTEFPMVVGLDGVQKMSKSYNNQIEICATPKETEHRIASAVTDPARKLRSDLGHPEVCNIFRLHQFFSPGEADRISTACRCAGIGCVECKKLLAGSINDSLAPFRARRAEIEAKKGLVDEAIAHGAIRARAIARETIREAKDRMGLPACLTSS